MAKNLSKVISGDELRAFQRWTSPEVSSPKSTANKIVVNSTVTTSAQIEDSKRQAYQEGFQQGREDGMAAGKEEHKLKLQNLDRIIKTLNVPLLDMDEQVIDQLVALATTIARHMIRRELKTDPGEVVGIVRVALASLPVATRDISIYLHPEDVALVREALSLSGDGQTYKIIEDPATARGGCRVVTDSSQVDASIEKRLTALVTQLMGGEREHDGNS